MVRTFFQQTRFALIGFLVSIMGMSVAAEHAPGLLAYYPMREGRGEHVRDQTEQRPDGIVHQSFWTSKDGLQLLDFGGMKNSRGAYVDLGRFALTGDFTFSLWVSAYCWENRWEGLIYQSDATCGLRSHRDHPGQLDFRIKGKDEKRGHDLRSNTVLERDRWYHIVAVFRAGHFMRIYIDGELDAENKLNVPMELGQDNNSMWLGGGKSNYFSGCMTNVRIYDRALDADEVKQLYHEENIFRREPVPVASPAARSPQAACLDDVTVTASGGLDFQVNGEHYTLESLFSYPTQPRAKFNALTLAPSAGGEATWQVSVKQPSPSEVHITANGSTLRLERSITQVAPGKYRFRDTFANPTDTDQAVIFCHVIRPLTPPTSWFLYGQEKAASAADGRMASANPTLMILCPKSALAFVAEDDIFRCLLDTELRCGKPDWCFMPGSNRFGIPAGKSHELEFTIDTNHTDYFDFLNDLRQEWKVPEVTIDGPLGGALRIAGPSSSAYRVDLAPHPEKFKAYFARRNQRMVTLNPWYTFWDAAIYANRDEYKKAMQDAMRTVRAVNPEMKFFASLETYAYCLRTEEFSEPIPEKFNWTKSSPAATKLVLATPWRDSVELSAAGEVRVYPMSSVPNGQPALPIMVYPALGNHFDKVRREDFDFLLDEVGFDGIYQDMFGFSGPGSVLHGRWDGFTVAIAPDGTIAEKFTHLGPYTAPARAAWLRHILDKGKLALTNFGAPTTRELQTIPYLNFGEFAGRGVGRQDLDSIPPDSSGAAMNQLSTPLGYGPHKSEEIDATRLMARVRAYLRYGVLYVHTSIRNYFPETGPGSGEYGPINHMYPITPVELHRGWVKGKERIVSCVSFQTVWKHDERPKALRFDAVGRDKPVDDAVKISGESDAWNIEATIDDWQEFIIFE